MDTSRSFGRTAEELLGSSHTAGIDVPSINGVPIFTPSTDVKGAIEANQTTANQSRAAQLAKEEALRKLSGMSDFKTQDLVDLYK